MNTLSIIILILFIISQGSIAIHRLKNADAISEHTMSGFLVILTFLPLLMIVLSLIYLMDLKWYWSTIFSFLLTRLFSVSLAEIYSSIFGYKSKPQLSLRAGGMVKHNLHIVDFFITFFLGLILFLFA